MFPKEMAIVHTFMVFVSLCRATFVSSRQDHRFSVSSLQIRASDDGNETDTESDI